MSLTMNTDVQTLINAYVADVARQLPRRQRNDVAFELQALLQEELQAKADESGLEAPDSQMALQLLRAFGRPEDVAARYRPTLTVIAPEDGHAFVRATAIGLGVIWLLGLLKLVLVPAEGSGAAGVGAFLQALAAWWGGTVLPSLIWPGLLVVGYGLANWSRQRRPAQAKAWTPPRGDELSPLDRAGVAMGVVGTLAGTFALVNPPWLLALVWGGPVPAPAYQALAYSEAFVSSMAPWLLLLVLLNVPLLAAVGVTGRRTPLLRQLDTVLSLLTFVAMLWTALQATPVFQQPATDQSFKLALLVLTAITLWQLAARWWRQVRPQPDAVG
ncbi:MAG: hypothetical protein CFE46_11260 [Burkholderiales bacterium PBB6]|nr:MAG: hypothetical protein CFE46_11260 [Burkholderiales bacterium PBB6]